MLNDLNILQLSHIVNSLLNSSFIEEETQSICVPYRLKLRLFHIYSVCPLWCHFMKSVLACNNDRKNYAAWQDASWKDIEWASRILQLQWKVLNNPLQNTMHILFQIRSSPAVLFCTIWSSKNGWWVASKAVYNTRNSIEMKKWIMNMPQAGQLWRQI